MSAGVTNNIQIYREVFTIPQAAVQAMDSNAAFTLIATNNKFYAIPIACYVNLLNSTTPYSGFVHLHLTNTGNYGTQSITAVLSENATTIGIKTGPELFSMLVNCQQAGFFGGVQSFKNLEIYFDTLPTAGDGDMVVTLFYTINELF